MVEELAALISGGTSGNGAVTKTATAMSTKHRDVRKPRFKKEMSAAPVRKAGSADDEFMSLAGTDDKGLDDF